MGPLQPPPLRLLDAPVMSAPSTENVPDAASDSALLRQERACIGFEPFDWPIVAEVTPWVHVAGGWRAEPTRTRGLLSLGAGVDATFGIATFGGGYRMLRLPGASEPVRVSNRHAPAVQLRAGPWLGLETPLDRLRGEGGLSMTLGSTTAYLGSFGTFGLRVGAGYSTIGVPHAVAALGWGARVVPARRATSWSNPACSSWCRPCDPPSVAIASLAFVFASLRRSFDPTQATEVVFGIELGWPPAAGHDLPNG
jgi:hypothetical protein